MDIVYALWLDDLGGERHHARERLDEYLLTPFDRVEAAAYKRERWGMTGEDLRDRQKSAAVWGDT